MGVATGIGDQHCAVVTHHCFMNPIVLFILYHHHHQLINIHCILVASICAYSLSSVIVVHHTWQPQSQQESRST